MPVKKLLNAKVIAVAVAAVLIAVLCAVSLSGGMRGSDALSSAIRTASGPGSRLMSSLVGGLEKLYGYLYRYDELEAENARLAARVAELEADYRQFEEIAAENDRLHKLLNMSERGSKYELCSAAVISWGASNWSSSFTISKGSDDGISVGDPVITELSYVVGRVTAVQNSSATVTTILDTSSSIGATIYKTGDAAVAQGDFSLMGDNLLRLSYLPEDVELIAGDAVLSSGKGGVFPSGLLIGEVTDVVPDPVGSGRYAVISPAADFYALTSVHVITDYNT